MDYGALEVEIVDRLNAYFNSTPLVPNTGFLSSYFKARVFPSNQEDLLQDYAKGVVNVQYCDSEFFDPDSTALIMQREQVKVMLMLQVNNSAGADGAYALLDAVKASLVGYKPCKAINRMWVSDYNTWQINDGQLMPWYEFSFDTICEQRFDDSEDVEGGLLVDVVMD